MQQLWLCHSLVLQQQYAASVSGYSLLILLKEVYNRQHICLYLSQYESL